MTLIVSEEGHLSVESQDAYEKKIIVGKLCHWLDQFDMSMLCPLAAGVVKVAPQHNLPDLVQDTLLLF